MRHNQNGRRFRGRNNDGGQRHQGGGGNHTHHHSHSGGGSNTHTQGRRVNPRMQTFDSQGPEVRIRGTAYQINEKYVTLARDANSAGDRVLAESYLQHAEHYQRQINEMTEEYNKYNPPLQQQQPQQQPITGEEPQPSVESTAPVHQQQQQQPSGDSHRGDGNRSDGNRSDGNRNDGNRNDGNRHDNNRHENNRPDNNRPDNNRNDGNRNETQPADDLHDLDQGFLRGPRSSGTTSSSQQQQQPDTGETTERRPQHHRSKEPQSV